MTARDRYEVSAERAPHGLFARFTRGAAIVLTSAMALGWIVLGSLYVRGRVILGHWPRINIDDPSALALGLHYTIAGYSVVLCFLGTVAALVLICVVLVVDRQAGRASIILALVAAALSSALFVLTPWVSWYLD